MNAAQLKASILQQAIEGKLVSQLPEEGVVEQIGDIPSEVAFEIPDSWKWIKLSDVVDVRDGTHDSPKYVEKGVPFVTSKNLKNGTIDFSTVKFISKKDHESFIQRSNVEPGDILMAMIGSIGNAIMVPENAPEFSIKNVALFKHKADKLLDFEFLLVLLKSLESIMNTQSSGSVQKFVPLKYLRNMAIPLPPLAEQRRIVAKIEELLPMVEDYGKAYDKLQELNDELPSKLKASILQDAIQGKLVPQLHEDGVVEQIGDAPAEVPFELPASWKWVPLVELTKDMADGPFGSNLKKEHYTDNKEVRIIQLSNIGENGWRNDNVKYTTYKHAETIARSKAKAGDIVIAKMMPAGRSVIVPELDNAYILSSDAVKAVVNTDLCINTYLNYAINSTIFKSQVYSNVQGTTRIRTSLTKLKNFLVPLPPLAEQKRIVAKLETLLKQVDMMIK